VFPKELRDRGKDQSYTALMCDLLEEEPTCFEEAIQRKEWADAMTKEHQSIMKNEV
jgi:hypothetical protein